MIHRHFRLFVLLTVVGLTTSCGLVRAPFRIVGGLTRGAVEAGRKAKANAQAKKERKRLEKQAKQQQQDVTPGTMDGGVLPPIQDENGGEVPDLILEPLPPPEEATLPALPR